MITTELEVVVSNSFGDVFRDVMACSELPAWLPVVDDIAPAVFPEVPVKDLHAVLIGAHESVKVKAVPDIEFFCSPEHARCDRSINVLANFFRKSPGRKHGHRLPGRERAEVIKIHFVQEAGYRFLRLFLPERFRVHSSSEFVIDHRLKQLEISLRISFDGVASSLDVTVVVEGEW